MASTVPLIVRVLASSVSVANRAGKIVRDVMSKGELGIVEKVSYVTAYMILKNLHFVTFDNIVQKSLHP